MMKQDTAHVIVNGEKILVLRRSSKFGVSLKIRYSGKDGMYLPDESANLETRPKAIDVLKRGEVVYC